MKALVALVLVVVGVAGSGCIIHVTHYTENDGSTVYVGEFYSEGNSYDSTAKIQGKFFDAGGNVIATKTGPICLGVNAHSVIPFKVVLPPGTPAADHVEWSVVGAPADPALATGLEASIVSEVNIPALPGVLTGGTQFSGMLRNNSTNQYFRGSVCMAWYDASGSVVRMDSTNTEALRFAPGTSIPFVMEVSVPAGAVRRSMFLDAGVAPPGGSLPTVIDIAMSQVQHIGHLNAGLAVYASGEVVNAGSSSIHEPNISVVGTNGAGQTVVGGSLHICPFDIPAGATSFLEWGVMGGTSGVPSSPTATIQATASTKNPGMALATSSVTKSAAGTTTTVTGTLKNSTEVAIKYAGVCAAVYDASGNVVAGSYSVPTLPGGTLPAGGTVSFSVSVAGSTGVSVKTVAVGYEQ